MFAPMDTRYLELLSVVDPTGNALDAKRLEKVYLVDELTCPNVSALPRGRQILHGVRRT